MSSRIFMETTQISAERTAAAARIAAAAAARADAADAAAWATECRWQSLWLCAALDLKPLGSPR